MFDIGFSELILVFVIGLVVLGPQRLPVAVKTVVGWIRALRSLANNVQNELAQELKLQELQDSLKKVEEASKQSLSPEFKASMEELKQSAEAMKRSYLGDSEKTDDEVNTIHNPVVRSAVDSHESVTPASADHQANSPAQAPVTSSQSEQATVNATQATEVAQPRGSVSEATMASVQTSTVRPEAIPAVTESDIPVILSSRAPVSTSIPSDER